MTDTTDECLFNLQNYNNILLTWLDVNGLIDIKNFKISTKRFIYQPW